MVAVPSPSKAASVVLVLLVAALFGPACVQVQCQLNSDCPEHSSCISNQCISRCGGDRDCTPAAPFCNVNGVCVATMADAGVDVRSDTGVDAPHDSGQPIDNYVPPVDNYVPPVDNYVPPVDNYTPPVLRAYLDACGSDADCASGICTTNAPRFCSRTCSLHSDCADGLMCSGGRCVLDDTGTPGCNPTTAAPCNQY